MSRSFQHMKITVRLKLPDQYEKQIIAPIIIIETKMKCYQRMVQRI
jgi:hypothetical protein